MHDRPQTDSTPRATTTPLKPWPENPRYWSRHDEPLLLLGASDEDNLFQHPDLDAQLDRLHAAGGNAIRCTMSSRDPGDEQPYERLDDGRYDLNRFNPKYWGRFDRLLGLSAARDIFVQVEVWDRFDYSREPWRECPFNPANNVNYSAEESGLASEYPEHPGRCLQPFFHTVPELDDRPFLRAYQERFVDQLLAVSLKYRNVLYCISNETHEDPAWGVFWMGYIRSRAEAAGVEVLATDMFDGKWESGVPASTRMQIDQAAVYPYLEVSQLSAWRVSFERHWANLMELRRLTADEPRPMYCTKVYGADTFDKGVPLHAVRTGTIAGVASFWMNLMGGVSSARFHRPPSGLGLSEIALNSIRMARWLEKLVPFWSWAPLETPVQAGEGRSAYAVERREDGLKDMLLLLPEGGQLQPDQAFGERFPHITWIDPVVGQVWPNQTLQPSGMVRGVTGRPLVAWLHHAPVSCSPSEPT